MLIDTIKKYYGDAYDYNCAEANLHAANEHYNLGLGEDTLKAMAAFGGGMSTEKVCGAISASLVVLSILFVREKAHESDVIKKVTKEFYRRFLECLGTDQCDVLKAGFRTEEFRCIQVFYLSSAVLEEIIAENQELICYSKK